MHPVRWVGATALVAIVVISQVLGNLPGQPVLLSYAETGSMAPRLNPSDGFVAVDWQLGWSALAIPRLGTHRRVRNTT